MTVRKELGSACTGGTINQNGVSLVRSLVLSCRDSYLQVRATHVGEDTALSQTVRRRPARPSYTSWRTRLQGIDYSKV